MKIQELFEAAGKDYSANVEALEKTQEFKKFSEKFDLVSTPRQRKNGSLQLETKDHVLSLKREFFVNDVGVIKVKNAGTSIWAKAGKVPITVGPIGSTARMVEAIKIIEQLFDEWFDKRSKNGLKSGKDLSNLNIDSLVGLNLPKHVKEFDCSHNNLKSLEGAPAIDPTSDFNCANNHLISPLVGAPKECRIFSAGYNKLSTFEGFPEITSWIHAHSNNFSTYKGVEKHLKSCKGVTIDFTYNGKPIGLLSFFKVKDCSEVKSYEWVTGNSLPLELRNEVKLVQGIINKHLKEGRNVVACQEELFQNGLDGYAKL